MIKSKRDYYRVGGEGGGATIKGQHSNCGFERGLGVEEGGGGKKWAAGACDGEMTLFTSLCHPPLCLSESGRVGQKT